MPSKDTYFKKGHKGYWSGKKMTEEHRNKMKETALFNLKIGKNKMPINKSGEQHPTWKGDKIGYYGIHKWLQSVFGKASKCEQCGSEKKVQWAKLKGKEYQRRRENFWMLCAICHINYDNTSIGRFARGPLRSVSSNLKVR